MQLARSLIADNHRVTLVDIDAERVREASNQLDCAVIHAKSCGLDVLRDAGLSSTDALVAVTARDELNMLVCSLVNAVHPEVQKIARVCDGDHFRNFMDVLHTHTGKFTDSEQSTLGIDWVVNPDVEMAKRVTRMVMRQRKCGILELEDGYVVLSLTLGAASPLVGKTVGCLFEVKDWHYRMLCVYDEDVKTPTLATLDTVIGAGKRLDILARMEDLQSVVSLCDVGDVENVRVLIAGVGPLVPLMVTAAQSLGKDRECESFMRGSWHSRVRMDVAVVDESPERCRQMVERFAGLKVLLGDVTDPDLVREEGLNSYSQSLSFTGNYDHNLITAAYLKSCGVPLTVALTANSDVVNMAEKLGVDVAVPIRETVVESIKNHLYGRNVLQVESVAKGAFDLAYCTMTKHGLIPDDSVLLLVKGKGETEFHAPDVHTELAAGDRLLLMVPAGRLEDVRKSIG